MVNPGVLNKEYLSFSTLRDPDIICAFSSRIFSNMSLLQTDKRGPLNNRKNFLNTIGINYKDLVCMKQIHGDSVRYVDETDKGRGALNFESSLEDIDALITDKKSLPLSVFSADCLSIFLYDPASKTIGIVHAGWRGTKARIASKTVELMQQKFDSRPKDLCIGFGPAIRDCCYEVGKEFSDYFSDGLIRRDDRLYLDLIGINKTQLFKLGVSSAHLFDSGICTACRNKEFFSFRKQKDKFSRIMSVIMLRQ